MKTKLIGLCCLTVCLVGLGILFATIPTQGQKEQEKVKSTAMKNLDTHNNLQKHGIELVGASDAEFDSVLKEYLGNNKDDMDPIMRAAKSISVLIVNNSGKDVVGCTLLWKFSKPNGETEIVPQNEASPGVLMGMKLRDPAMKGKTSLISSNESRFFSFDNPLEQILVNMNMARNNPEQSSSLIPNRLDDALSKIESNRNQLASTFSDVSVSIDGIFFSDGTFVGDDNFFFFDMMSGEIQARKDFIKLVSEANSKNTDMSKVLSGYISLNQVRPKDTERTSSQAAFRFGYDSHAYNLAKEISRRKTRFSDQAIARDYVLDGDSKKVALRKQK